MQHQQDNIDRFLLNLMDEKERQTFEKLMSEDSDLANEVHAQKEVYDIVKVLGNKEMKVQLDEIHNKVVGPSRRFSLRILSLVAGFFFLLGGAYLFYLTQSKPSSSNELYVQYYAAPQLSFASRNNEVTGLLQQANALYRNEQYKQALLLLESLVLNDSDSKLQLAAGISALETAAYQKASKHFDAVIKYKDPLYISQAQWYAAMTALKSNSPQLARQYLQALIDSGISYKQAESQEILRMLK